ncbi:MAG: hypothetical protein AAGG75_18450 [Bacteroidota bacterium]
MKYLVLAIFLFISCSTTISKKNRKLEIQDYPYDPSLFEVIIQGKEVPYTDLQFSLIEYTDSSMNRDTFVDISFQKWIFRIRESYIIKEGLNEIKYDNRIFKNSVKKQLVHESLFFCRKHFILDNGGHDIYLIPILRK